MGVEGNEKNVSANDVSTMCQRCVNDVLCRVKVSFRRGIAACSYDCCSFNVILSSVLNLVILLSSSNDTIDTSEPASTLKVASDAKPEPIKGA